MSAEKWTQWVWMALEQGETCDSIARTGGLFTSLKHALVLPAIAGPLVGGTYLAAGPVLQYVVTQMTQSQWGSLVAKAMVSRLLAVPVSLFWGGGRAPQRTNALELISDLLSGRQRRGSVSEWSPQSTGYTLILGLSALSVLFFEYVGMEAMQNETKKGKILNNTHTLAGYCRQSIQTLYETGTAYYTSAQPEFSLAEISLQRTIYNVLVGVNTKLFSLVGYSTDPTAEVFHWTAVWLYWEVLVRLVRLHGWSPVGAAVRMLFAKLHRP